MKGTEITRAFKLCDERGKLNRESVGWSRHPMIYCNLRGSFLRKKKWNYWCVTSHDALFSITVSHLDYAAVVFAYVLDLRSHRFVEESIMIPLGRSIHMPDNVQETITLETRGVCVDIKENKATTDIQLYWPKFHKEEPLEAQLTVERMPHQESLNVVIPWSDERFQYTSKQVALPAEGFVNWSEGTYQFEPTSAFATLDFGRGKWPYRSNWNWGAASGMTDGYRVGLNFGGQWTEGTGQTENGFIINGRLNKIHDEIDWIYDKNNYLKPWIIHSPNDKQVKLMFEPIFERVSKTNVGLIKSNVHQLIGYYNGTIEANDGRSIQINQLFGWAEDHQARW
ncbi:DUF2804 domain-containing protein [Tenuibacillus multivorans]|uniref:DUF2804 domain-containing protein n=1 Tax=Tenuibacillus multivorans TaxID=237069 RepID=A0A1H0ARM2_9BACI|nr:DUF2804 domain-containing protein [Tenuibacillus multivorans]GEL77862.1 hypothetical protein TMU01_20970 [Tenuibacillus multivorans]SDN35723.1 Protein of unknown function [Tenuibacillus multivorans]